MSAPQMSSFSEPGGLPSGSFLFLTQIPIRRHVSRTTEFPEQVEKPVQNSETLPGVSCTYKR